MNAYRPVRFKVRAEGASLDLAKPDETLRQKDPVPESTLENLTRDTDGVRF